MLVASLIAVLLAATGQARLAAPGFAAAGIEPEKVAAINEYFAERLHQYGVQVVTPSQISALLGLERQKQLLGCADDSVNCIAELGGALGVDALISGNIAQVGDELLMTVKVVRARDGKVLDGRSTRAANMARLLDWLDDIASAVAERVTPPAQERTGPRRWAWLPLVGAGALGAAAGVLLGLSHTQSVALRGPEGGSSSLSYPAALEAQRTGIGLQTAGFVVLGVASAALLVAALLFLLGDSPAPQAAP